ncbi:MAG: DMT family transporter [Bacillota bacterium]|nr:DMT family transporter [Bacillota bacterium]
MTKAESNIVLFSITLCWASSYIFIKNIPESISAFAYVTMTAMVARLILAFVFAKRIKDFDKQTLGRSAVLAAIICGNLVFERLGVAKIPASTASFIASLNIVFVPLLLLLFKRKLTLNNLVGIILIFTGLFITSGIKLGESVNFGVIAMTIACLFMAIYIITVDNFTKKNNPLLLGIGQMFFTALIGFGLWFIEEPKTFYSIVYTRGILANIFILAFFAKAYAYIMLMYTQKYASPLTVTVMASTEPVVTMTLALLIPNTFGKTEILSMSNVFGASFILVGAIVAGTNFLSRKNRVDQANNLTDSAQGS